MDSLRLLALPAALTVVWVLMAGASVGMLARLPKGERLLEPVIEQPLPAPRIQPRSEEIPSAPVA